MEIVWPTVKTKAEEDKSFAPARIIETVVKTIEVNNNTDPQKKNVFTIDLTIIGICFLARWVRISDWFDSVSSGSRSFEGQVKRISLKNLKILKIWIFGVNVRFRKIFEISEIFEFSLTFFSSKNSQK